MMGHEELCKTPTRVSLLVNQAKGYYTRIRESDFHEQFLFYHMSGFFVLFGIGAVWGLTGDLTILVGTLVWILGGFLFYIAVNGVIYAKNWYKELGLRVFRVWMKRTTILLLYQHTVRSNQPAGVKSLVAQTAILVPERDARHAEMRLGNFELSLPVYNPVFKYVMSEGKLSEIYHSNGQNADRRLVLTERGQELAEKCWNEAPDTEKNTIERVVDLTAGLTDDEFTAYLGATLKWVPMDSEFRERFERVRAAAAVSMVRSGKITEKEGLEISGLADRGFADMLADANAGDDPGPVDSRRHSD